MADREIEILKDDVKRIRMTLTETNKIVNLLLKQNGLDRGELLNGSPEPIVQTPKRKKVKDGGHSVD